MGKGLIGINWVHSLGKTLVTSMYFISHPQGLCGKGFMDSLKKTGQLLLMKGAWRERTQLDVMGATTFHFALGLYLCLGNNITAPLSSLHQRK